MEAGNSHELEKKQTQAMAGRAHPRLRRDE